MYGRRWRVVSRQSQAALCGVTARRGKEKAINSKRTTYEMNGETMKLRRSHLFTALKEVGEGDDSLSLVTAVATLMYSSCILVVCCSDYWLYMGAMRAYIRLRNLDNRRD